MSDLVVSQLKQVPLFSGLDDESLQMLARSCRRRHFPARVALFHQDDPGQTLYLIVSGRVNLQKPTAAGTTVGIAQRGPGDYIGEMSLLDGLPRSADAVTAEATDVLMLDRPEFLKCLKDSPKMALHIITKLTARLRESDAQLVSNQTLDVMGRLAAFLLEAAQTQGMPEPGRGGGVRLTTRLTQQEIASRIGTTRETVSRALTRLKTSGALGPTDSSGHLLIRDVEKLRRYCAV